MEFSNGRFRIGLGSADGLNMQVPHLHGHYELYYLLEGERQFFIRDTAYSMVPGTLAFLDGEELHRVFSHAGVPHKRLVIFFEKDTVTDPVMEQMFRAGGCLALNKRERADFDQTAKRLVAELSADPTQHPFRAEAVEALVSYLLICACRAHLAPRTPLRYGGTAVSDAVAYIGAHFAEPISLPQVCAAVGVSVSHFTAIFKASTGFTFVEYLNHIRIQHAAALLEETGMSVAEVAGAVGFSGFSYFSRRFQEIRGVSPLRYRKERRQ